MRSFLFLGLDIASRPVDVAAAKGVVLVAVLVVLIVVLLAALFKRKSLGEGPVGLPEADFIS